MASKTLYSIFESGAYPKASELYDSLGIEETQFRSMRKAISALKNKPDYIVAEFEYGYGNNYAGVNISNLDVMLYSLQKYSPETQVIVLVDKSEFQYVDKLNEIIRLKDILKHPLNIKQLRKALTS